MDKDTFGAFRDLSEKIGKVIEGQENTLRYIENVSMRTRAVDDKLQAHALDHAAHGAEEPGKVKDRHIALAGVFIAIFSTVVLAAIEIRKGGTRDKENVVVDGAVRNKFTR